MTNIDFFKKEIDDFAKEYVTNYPSPRIKETGKVIHDSLWGTQYLPPHEIATLDLPLIQRLRQIRQTASTFLIFPSTTHTRFEHTLGVIYQSDRLANSLLKNPDNKKLIEGKIDLIRMAALLHDCGHGPFSHSSEEIYKFKEDIQEIIGPGGKFEGHNPHEILSYFIIKSNAFKNKFQEIRDAYKLSFNIDDVANIIIGKVEDPLNKYLVDFINGPFDADKLDYIFRDGHFSGLPLKVDLDRLWYAAQIQTVPVDGSKVRMLAMSINGTTPLEQIIFSKMVLFTNVYQHHKVRTCDCMFKAIFEYCKNEKESICDRKFDKATDFLWLTDETLFYEAHRRKKDDPLHKLIHNLQYRRLLKRALIISKTTVKDSDKDFFGHSNLKKFCIDIESKDRNLRELAKKIVDAAGNPCDLHDVWVDLPKLPPIGSADEIYVNKGTIKKPSFSKLRDIFRVDDWAQDYSEHKWRGHVFCPDNKDIRKKISDAAKQVIESEFNIKFDDSAIKMCKLEECLD